MIGPYYKAKAFEYHMMGLYSALPASPHQVVTITDVVRLASRFGRYGYRQITNLLRIEGWRVNHKRVERIWREEGPKVPRRQPKRGRLWLNDGSCIRLRPLHKNGDYKLNLISGAVAMTLES